MKDIINFAGYLYCSRCGRSWGGLSVMDKGFYAMMREAYAKGWRTTSSDPYEGGDGRDRAYCPNCSINITGKETEMKFCVD